jgi:hypothetical protein
MEDEEEDSEIGSDVSLPFHLRMHMKTEFLYKEISIFLAEFPTTENERKFIRENPKILSRERNMVPDIKDKPS